MILFQIGWENIWLLKKSKLLYRRHMLLVISTVKELLEQFMTKSCKRQIKQSLR